MKTYKHRKTGEIATYKDGVLKSSGFCVEIKPSEEHWEEIVEKGYEVLSLINKETGDIITYEHGGRCYPLGKLIQIYESKDYWVECFVGKHPDLWEINSIKRLSDGEVFSKKDVLINLPSTGHGTFTLRAFELEVAPADKGTGRLTFLHDNKILGKWLHLKDLKKVNPLFTTEEGTPKYKFDKYVYYDIKNDSISVDLIAFGLTPEEYKDEKVKYFSTREKAEEYILMNKPCLSVKDVLDLGFFTNSTKEKLLTLVKDSFLFNDLKNNLINLVKTKK